MDARLPEGSEGSGAAAAVSAVAAAVEALEEGASATGGGDGPAATGSGTIKPAFRVVELPTLEQVRIKSVYFL